MAIARKHYLWCAAILLIFIVASFFSPWSKNIYDFIPSVPELSRKNVEDYADNFVKVSPDEFDASNAIRGVFVQSSGYGSGDSFVQNNGLRISLSRGLTLVGISDGRVPVKLSHMDTCGGVVVDKDALDHSGDFRFAVKSKTDTFDVFLLVGHDSVICDKASHFNKAALVTTLEALKGVQYRQPYIAVITKSSKAKEFIGGVEESISLKAYSIFTPQKTPAQRLSDGVDRIAHAGGGYNGVTYTNSIDALDFNKNKYSLFEIDFSWTSDGEIVCLHDWDKSFERSFNRKTEGPVTYRRFVELVNNDSEFEKCTLSTLAAWLEKNSNKRIVTDIKYNNIDALKLIAKRYPRLRHRFVPQIYTPNEYSVVRGLGFSDVIWTLYRFRGDNSSVLSHLQSMDLYGLAKPRYRADTGLAKLAFKKTGVLSYVHTINNERDYSKYLDLGVSEIYTDWIY